jgi:hypothetical protein
MQQKLEERKYLNEQIINHQRLIFQIFTFSIIAAVAILGWGLQSFPKSGTETSWLTLFLLLAPMAIVVPCAFIISAIRQEIFGWAAYIIVFHEGEEDFGYEKALDKIRDKVRPFRESYTPLCWTYLALLGICSGLFIWAILNSCICNRWSALVAIPIGLLVYWTIKFINIPSRSNRAKLKNEWLKVKEELLPKAGE